MKAVKFGEFNMQSGGVSTDGFTGGVTVVRTDVYSPPKKAIQADSLAERDGALIVKQQWERKTFTVEGHLRAVDAVTLEMLMDTFKTALAVKSQPFDIQHAGSVRRYLASQENIIISIVGPTTANFSVQFLSPDGMGWDVDSSSLIASTNVSQSAATIPFTVGGSYKADPIIRVVINTVSGGASKTLTIGNASTLRTVSITRNWQAGDIVEMDTLKGELLVNGVAHDYRGALLSYEPGMNGLTYNDEFTNRDVTITSSYTRRWL